MPAPGVVVIGGHVNGLGLVRAFAARGVRAAVVRTKPYDLAHRSRWVSATADAFGIETRPELLVELLESRASAWRGWVLVPTNDEALAALAGEHERLSAHYVVAAPPWDVARSLVDKDQMLDAARSVGADLPCSYGPASAETAGRDDLRFPVVVKPTIGYRFASVFGTKLFMADDRQALERCVSRLVAAKLDAHVFEFVPGRDDRIYAYCTYLDGRGEPHEGITVHKLRQAPPLFGVARAAEVVPTEPDLRELTVELLRRIGFRGIAVAEFKRDPRDESFRFIEINGRSVVYNELLRRVGFDLAEALWSDYVGGDRVTSGATGWPGIWVNVHADLLYSLLHRGSGRTGLAELVASYRRPVIDAVWSPRDPGPFIEQWSQTARDGLKALWQGTLSERLADRARVSV